MRVEYFKCNGCSVMVIGKRYRPHGLLFPPEDWLVVNVDGNVDKQRHYCSNCKLIIDNEQTTVS